MPLVFDIRHDASGRKELFIALPLQSSLRWRFRYSRVLMFSMLLAC